MTDDHGAPPGNGGPAVEQRGATMAAALGFVIRRRREARGLSLEDVQAAIGGTPSQGFLARVEDGTVGPASGQRLKLATLLELPFDLLLNAGGYATEAQRMAALVALGNDAGPPGSPGG